MTAPPRPSRRFPSPWRAERTPGGYVVVDAGGQRVAYVYGEDGPQGVASTKLTVDEARRIAAGIRQLPELLARKPEGS